MNRDNIGFGDAKSPGEVITRWQGLIAGLVLLTAAVVVLTRWIKRRDNPFFKSRHVLAEIIVSRHVLAEIIVVPVSITDFEPAPVADDDDGCDPDFPDECDSPLIRFIKSGFRRQPLCGKLQGINRAKRLRVTVQFAVQQNGQRRDLKCLDEDGTNTSKDSGNKGARFRRVYVQRRAGSDWVEAEPGTVVFKGQCGVMIRQNATSGKVRILLGFRGFGTDRARLVIVNMDGTEKAVGEFEVFADQPRR